MTTTLESMEQTVALVKQAGADISVMVGGAVLTEAYAKKIGADYYAADAMAAVGIAKKVYS
jgi:5-methyltetrahydrofolate--homocysteine methyltransferase